MSSTVLSKVVIINGKRFLVGNSKIKPTKCPDYSNPNRKKILSKEERITLSKESKENTRKPVEKKKKIKSRESKRLSRKRRE